MKHFVLALTLATVVGSAHAASFDCSKARAADERAVCSDPRLSELDSLLSKAFAEAKSFAEDEPEAKALARSFLRNRRACGSDRACITTVYAGALQGYWAFGSTIQVPSWLSALDIANGKAPARDTLPTKIGQCTTTQVAKIHPRLEGDPDYESGIAVGFSNGGYQVSYELDAAVRGSALNDDVVMCLTFVPRDCPPGDTRGRIYTVTNLRTRGTWSLPDSAHRCGGA